MSRRPRVLTPKGWLEGTEERGVQVFRGIPFAASTAGEGQVQGARSHRALAGHPGCQSLRAGPHFRPQAVRVPWPAGPRCPGLGRGKTA